MKIPATVKRVLGIVTVSLTLISLPTFACELAGPDTHVGEVKAIDLGESSLTILDGQMKKSLTFVADREQLKGLSLGQMVVVKYSKAGRHLRAEEIQAR